MSVFVPATVYGNYSNPSSQSDPVPSYNEFIQVDNIINHSVGNDFFEIKRADVDGSCSDCDSQFTGVTPESRSFASRYLELPSIQGKVGDVIEIPIFGTNLADFDVISVALKFSPQKFEITNSRSVSLSDFSLDLMNKQALSEGLMRFVWINMSENKLVTEENEPLFYVSVELLEDINKEELKDFVSLQENIQECATASNGQSNAFDLKFAENENRTQPQTHNLTVFPNPVLDILNFSIPKKSVNSNVEIEIFDATGKSCGSYNKIQTEGKQSVSLSLIDLPQGLYFYSVLADSNSYTGKFVKK